MELFQLLYPLLSTNWQASDKRKNRLCGLPSESLASSFSQLNSGRTAALGRVQNIRVGLEVHATSHQVKANSRLKDVFMLRCMRFCDCYQPESLIGLSSTDTDCEYDI